MDISFSQLWLVPYLPVKYGAAVPGKDVCIADRVDYYIFATKMQNITGHGRKFFTLPWEAPSAVVRKLDHL